MKIIITGASGFVGQNLAKHLQDQNHSVQELSLRKSWVLDKKSDAVIHLAGKAHDTANTSAEEEYFKVNRDLAIQLFHEFLNSDIKDFFYFSSVKATADIMDGILDENHLSAPKTPYGKSKLEAENYLLSKELPIGKRLFIIRPCMIHGPGNKGNLNLLYKIVEKGLPWPLAAFKNSRSFLSIDNLNFLISQMLVKENLSSGIYNFADDKAISTNELISTVNVALGKNAKLWKISKNLIIKTAALGDKLRLPLNSERLKKLTESYIVSNKKIKSALQIEQLPLSVEEGLIKTIKSFKK
ncbi:N-acetyl-alpha-D-glucosaminyl-diphospho-ditrans, octacis-undecaprenol 4-epimerase [Chryseobacterium aquaeductus]|uniref:N-acetyl-alpha-D-glucosaminyl-diphospho-ditrans, octacis-undecaprenol 4-epimerase n=1 Tax=Chryseobacterium aquaeductus TaxID=2675056 RepID=A0A9N8MHI5_9FLAO|nr:NAD-dependent epimerase/dehydratase family protein [Chryseobacterium aquaeductus]CAA7331610.1 N-acetyl-alpha-D-glucosaminyl-diphospho-ditrans, octacis-undecaprenol 4-epimerase [Chryseobacterium potabilaquae]CAD7811237.1 N-acetyl-alpha-D-glucosaminyl-diphospho-ditrans, octacis-undecaprenol 4-epimerase [Chryseobacterium aquaeductus]